MSSEVAPNPSSSIFNQSYFSTTDTTGLDIEYLALNYLAYPVAQNATETIDSLAITQQKIVINDITLGSGANTSATNNTACGVDALINTTGAGDYNTAFGYQAQASTTTGDNNTSFGSLCLSSATTGYHNTAVGYDALGNNTGGINNDAVGSGALANTVGTTTTGRDNTAVGYRAGYTNTTGSYNTFIGCEADATGTNYEWSTAIGYQAQATGSNQVVLGTSSNELLYYSYITPTYTSPTFGAGAIGAIISDTNSGGAVVVGTTNTGIVYIDLTPGTWFIVGSVYISTGTTTIARTAISFDIGSSPTYFPSSIDPYGSYNQLRYVSGTGADLVYMQISTAYYTSSSVRFRMGGFASSGTWTVPNGRGVLRAIRIA